MNTYIFHRDEGFYPIELKDDMDAIENAKCNSGTLKVETLDGMVIWTSLKEKT